MENKQQNNPQRRSRSSRSGRATNETEEEAIIRRFHDAQRMARFRARKKKAAQTQQVDKIIIDQETDTERQLENRASCVVSCLDSLDESKYNQLLMTLERLGKDVRLSYAGSRSSAERLKSGITKARSLVRDCLIEIRLNLRQ